VKEDEAKRYIDWLTKKAWRQFKELISQEYISQAMWFAYFDELKRLQEEGCECSGKCNCVKRAINREHSKVIYHAKNLQRLVRGDFEIVFEYEEQLNAMLDGAKITDAMVEMVFDRRILTLQEFAMMILYAVRDNLGLTLEDIGRVLNVNKSTVSRNIPKIAKKVKRFLDSVQQTAF